MTATEPGLCPRVGAIVLARTDSTRLPGKILADVQGRPLIWYLAQRLLTDRVACPVVLATTARPVDDELAERAAGLGFDVYRGDCNDVAGRMVGAARHFAYDAIYRINGDSPFVMPELLQRARAAMGSSDVKLVTNLRPRSFPYGVSVELFLVEALEECLQMSDEPTDREHVTSALYRHLPVDAIGNLFYEGGGRHTDISQLRLTIDTQADLEDFRSFIAATEKPWPAVTVEDALESVVYKVPGP